MDENTLRQKWDFTDYPNKECVGFWIRRKEIEEGLRWNTVAMMQPASIKTKDLQTNLEPRDLGDGTENSKIKCKNQNDNVKIKCGNLNNS